MSRHKLAFLILHSVFLSMLLSGCKNPLSKSSKVNDTFSPGLGNDTTASPATSTLVVNSSPVDADGVSSTTITITLLNENSEPITGEAVTFSVTGTGNVITQPADLTDSNGVTTGTLRSTVGETKVVAISNPSGLATVTGNAVFTPLTPFNQTWELRTSEASNYSLSATSLYYTPTTLEHRDLAIDDDNDATYGFGGIVGPADVEWSAANSAMQLTAAGRTAGTGSFESRVFSAGRNVDWTNIAWQSRIPAGKPLPNNKAIETDFVLDNVDMSDNVLLLHMDELSWTGAANEVIDSSGSNHHATRVGTPNTTAVNPKFGRSGNFTANGQHLTIPHSADFDTTSRLTIEGWFYPTFSDANVRGVVSKRQSTAAANYAFALFNFTGNRLFFDINASSNRFDTNYSFVPNVWQHLAIVFDGTLSAASNNRLRVYVNGSLFSNMNTGPTSIQSTGASAPLHIASLVANNALTYLGQIDELAIYRRALSAAEIATRFRRGSHRIKIQARACPTSACAGVNYLGPGGLTTTYFTDDTNTSTSSQTSIGLTGFTNQPYFQYRTVFETNVMSLTPQLLAVAVTPTFYDSGNPTVTNNNGIAYKSLSSFGATSAGSGTIRYQLSNGTDWFYWNGANWVMATLGYAHTNTQFEVNNNIMDFPNDAGFGTLFFRAFYNSGATFTNPASLSNINVIGEN